MKNKASKLKVLLAFMGTISISACGGGGSDSGGVEKNVTSCISSESQTNSLGLTQTVLRNNCGFAVNLGRGLTDITAIVTLEPGATESGIFIGGFIACRPPSQPIDRDDSVARDLDCSD